MSPISRYLINGAPTRCKFCGNRFPVNDGHLEVWHNGRGAYFCNEYCASDEDQAQDGRSQKLVWRMQ